MYHCTHHLYASASVMGKQRFSVTPLASWVVVNRAGAAARDHRLSSNELMDEDELDSDDELMQRAFPVEGEEAPGDEPPATAEAYLRQVRYDLHS